MVARRAAVLSSSCKSLTVVAACVLAIGLVTPLQALDRVSIEIGTLRTPVVVANNLQLRATLDPSRPQLVGQAKVAKLQVLDDKQALELPAVEARYVLSPSASELEARWPELSIDTLARIARRSIDLPEDLSLEGRADIEVLVRGTSRHVDLLNAKASIRELVFANEAGDIAGENLVLNVNATSQRREQGQQLTLSAYADRGAALLGPVYLDVGAHAIELAASGILAGRTLALQTATLKQEELIAVQGSANMTLAQNFDPSATRIDSAKVTLERLQFPAAYVSLLQTALAGTVLGSLESRGEIGAELEIRDNQPVRARIDLRQLDFEDKSANRLRLRGLNGTLHWRPEGLEAPINSRISWNQLGAYGLDVEGSALDMVLQASTISLEKHTRLPILDGALRIDHFLLKDPSTEKTRLEFSGELEPIGMPALSRAFGWPEFSGVIRGRIPSVAYADKILAFEGDVIAEIFGGRLVGRDIRLTDPLGRWPKFSADIQFDNFDLEAVTRAFEVGTITGKLEGRIDDLELFAWSPVSFDAVIKTPDNDRSRHRISVKAINSIANVGGNAGTGVATALQGGLMRFFSSYAYKQLTFRCRLQNDVCLITGAGKEDDRYYLLEGKGLPRVDIFGYSGRVRWSQLVEQIRDQIESGGGDLRFEY